MARMNQVQFLSPIVNGAGVPYATTDAILKMTQIDIADMVLFYGEKTWADVQTLQQIATGGNTYLNFGNGGYTYWIKDGVDYPIIYTTAGSSGEIDTWERSNSKIGTVQYTLLAPFKIQWVGPNTNQVGVERIFYCPYGSTWNSFISDLNSAFQYNYSTSNKIVCPLNSDYTVISESEWNEVYGGNIDIVSNNTFVFFKQYDGDHVKFISGIDQQTSEYSGSSAYIATGSTIYSGEKRLIGVQSLSDSIIPNQTYYYAYTYGNTADGYIV